MLSEDKTAQQKSINYLFVHLLSLLEILYEALFCFCFVLSRLHLPELLILDPLEVLALVTSLALSTLVLLVLLAPQSLADHAAPPHHIPLIDLLGVSDSLVRSAGLHHHRDGDDRHLIGVVRAVRPRGPQNLVETILVSKDDGNVLKYKLNVTSTSRIWS